MARDVNGTSSYVLGKRKREIRRERGGRTEKSWCECLKKKERDSRKKLCLKLSFGDSPLFVHFEACLASVCGEKK